MAIEYFCTVCGKQSKRFELTVKKIVYHEMGKRGSMLRSRAVEWMCESCRNKDAPWNMEPYESPGTKVREIHRYGRPIAS